MKGTTTVYAQILAGNLGDGWADNNAAAQALAEFTESLWRSDLKELLETGVNVEFEIEVQANTAGASRAVEVVGPHSGEVQPMLREEQDVWELFCESPESAAHWRQP